MSAYALSPLITAMRKNLCLAARLMPSTCSQAVYVLFWPLVVCAFPPSFGMIPLIPASFGDIVTAANIAQSIYKALSASTGSSYEYQCLITELRDFERTLRAVDLAISVSPPSGDLAQDIGAETTRCLELLKTFLKSIEPYQKALGGSGKGAHSWRKLGRKIGWVLFRAEEVESFRRKLSHHKQNITLFLNSYTM